MATDNTVTLIGNLTDNPELRFTTNGVAVANFRLAVTPRIRQGDTWTDGETSFFRVNCWRQLAEHVTEILSKGARAIVIGRLRMRSWETDQGERRSIVEIEADEVALRRSSPPPPSSWSGCLAAMISRCGSEPCGGCCMRPPLAPTSCWPWDRETLQQMKVLLGNCW
jgi:single-strand DNA-binding protein